MTSFEWSNIPTVEPLDGPLQVRSEGHVDLQTLLGVMHFKNSKQLSTSSTQDPKIEFVNGPPKLWDTWGLFLSSAHMKQPQRVSAFNNSPAPFASPRPFSDKSTSTQPNRKQPHPSRALSPCSVSFRMSGVWTRFAFQRIDVSTCFNALGVPRHACENVGHIPFRLAVAREDEGGLLGHGAKATNRGKCQGRAWQMNFKSAERHSQLHGYNDVAHICTHAVY